MRMSTASPETSICEVPNDVSRKLELTLCTIMAYCMPDGKTSIQTRSSYREAVSTMHYALENGSDLHVNKRQKTRHYRARFTEEERMSNRDFF